MPRRILIIANKAWEVDPLVFVLRSSEVRPNPFPAFAAVPQVDIPLNNGTKRPVSARLCLQTDNEVAEVWCIKDLMDPGRSSSSSEEKARVLRALTADGPEASLVVAFGTAAKPDPGSRNGCVAVGSSVFVHDPHRETPNP